MWETIDESFKKSQLSFKHIKTERLCLKKFREHNTFIQPIAYCLGEREEFVHEGKHQVLKFIRVTAQFIPIWYVFQKLYEIPGLFLETMEYMNLLLVDKTLTSNDIQSNL